MSDGNVYFYSAKTNGFYPLSLKESVYGPAGAWPEDAKEISYETYSEFIGQPPDGKAMYPGDDGFPSWKDIEPPSKEDQVIQAAEKKRYLMNEAASAIAPLQDAVDLDMATDEEAASLIAWKKYRVLLNRIDTSNPPVNWPEKPQ